MDALLKKIESKPDIAKLIKITPEAVRNAYRRGSVPTTWLPKLIEYGFSIEELMTLPLQPEMSELLKTITSSYHMRRKSPKKIDIRKP